MKPNYKKYLNLSLAAALIASSPLSLSAQSSGSEGSKIKMESSIQDNINKSTLILAEQIHKLNVLKADLDRLNQLIDFHENGTDEKTILEKIGGASAILGVGAAAFSGAFFYKAAKSKDIRILGHGFASLFAGGLSLSLLSRAVVTWTAKKVTDSGTVEELKEVVTAKQDILEKQEKRMNALLKLAIVDKNSREELIEFVNKSSYKNSEGLAKINGLNEELNTLKKALADNNEEIGVSAYMAISQTISALLSGDGVNIAFATLYALITGNQVGDKAVIDQQIATLESSIEQAKTAYKAEIVEVVTRLAQ